MIEITCKHCGARYTSEEIKFFISGKWVNRKEQTKELEALKILDPIKETLKNMLQNQNSQLSKQTIQKRAKQINNIYNQAINKLRDLKSQQNKIISDYIKKLEQKKIEEIRKKIQQNN